MLRDESGAKLGILPLPDKTYEPAGNHTRILLWFGISLQGAMVACHIGKTQHVLEKEQTPLLAEAGTVGCGYMLCMVLLLAHKCECGVPVTDTCQLEVVPSGDMTSHE